MDGEALRMIVSETIREHIHPWPGCDDMDPDGAADAVLAALRLDHPALSALVQWLECHPNPVEALTNVFAYGYYANENDKTVLGDLIDALKGERP